MLFNSAMFAEKDLMLGISENVILGQLSPIGTGFFDLLLRVKDLMEPKYQPDQVVPIIDPQEVELEDNKYE